MEYRGSQFYDREEQFARYTARRGSAENANDTLEEPIIWEMSGDVKDFSILDVGCGDARFGWKLLQAGAKHYTGLEGSQNMYGLAVRTLQEVPSQSKVIHTTIEDWTQAQNPKEASSYDLVVSRLVLHYIEDLESIFNQIYEVMKPGGRFIFSVEHPVITSTLQPTGLRTDWVVDQYFVPGYRTQDWMGGPVMKFHRTVEDYFQAGRSAGFQVVNLRESKPVRERFIHQETYERRQRIPLFLFMELRKPAT
ncbi:methyltransferase [Paenibacillus sp. Marseille-Q4541]|uniref:class I SAM-dependent methyltransferase n=1 Tax=Paenibacillus sp. Marseille-Q4541 TaxID=2831522 RepID=UPI001BAABD11|nr:methyltransferase [Paenibacillus sp. Marseille-Q4541]